MDLGFLHRVWNSVRTGRLRQFIGLTFVLVVILLSTYASAVTDLTVFGPTQYNRLKGKPTVYTATFKNCSGSNQATLRVTNGSSKTTRIKSAEISINGTEVAEENEFQMFTPYFEKNITTQATNDIRVVLKGGKHDEASCIDDPTWTAEPTCASDPACKDNPPCVNPDHQSFLIIEIVGKGCDSTPPTISNPFPADASLISKALPVISAQYADNSEGAGIDITTVRMTVDGKDITSSASVTPASVSYTPSSILPEGSHTVTVSVSDLAHNPASLTWHFTTDTIAPVVKITSHQNGTFLKTPTITVSGTIDDSTATVTINGQLAQIIGNTFTLANLTLADGDNSIHAEAKDAANNIGKDDITITLDTVPPAITVSSPQPASFLKMPTITVTGSITELHPAGLWVNGIPVQITGPGFTVSGVPLALEGANNITVRATDLANNETIIIVPVTRDTIPPVVTITAPASGALVNTRQITVSGTVNEPITSIIINGTAVNHDLPIDFSGIVTLAEGLNTITVTAFDRALNPGTAIVLVALDSTAPNAPVITQPASPTKVPQINISGTAEPGATVKLSLLGSGQTVPTLVGTVTSTPQGTFMVENVTLTEGTNTFTAVATDAANNTSQPSAAVSVILDTKPPVITVTTPANNTYTNQSSILVTGTVDETANVTINGTPVLLNGLNFTQSVTLTSGVNSIVVAAVDLAGNPSSTTVLVNLDTTPPVVMITAPQANALVNTPQITVSGTVSEPVTSVIINNTPAQITGTSFNLTNFTLAEGASTITVTATDRAGNIGAGSVSLTLDSTPPAITLNAPAQAAAGSTVSISLNAQDVTSGISLAEVTANGMSFWSASMNAIPSTQDSVLYSIAPDLAPGSVVTLQAKATDLAGNAGTATAQLQINQGPSGPGYIQGEVYDDSKGLLLEGATAGFAAADGHGLTGITTQADGSYFTEAPKGSYFITLSKAGFISVERTVVVTPEKKSIAIDARLTPINTQQNVIDANGGTIKAGSSSQGQGSGTSNSGPGTLNLELSIPAGALTSQADIRVTPVSNQGLANLLPAGWSPIAAVDIHAVTANAELRTVDLVVAAMLKVPVLSVLGLAPTSPVTLASYDTTSHQWIGQGSGTVSADGAYVAASINSTGQYVLVLPDPGFLATVVPGQPLPLDPGATSIDPTTIVAAGSVVPPAAPPSPGLQATGQLMIAPASGSNVTLTSGMIVNANVTERFDLLSGNTVLPVDYTQDLVLYRYPCVTNIGSGIISIPTGSGGQGSGSTPNSALGTQNSENVGTTFPVTPSHQYTIVDLMMGKVSIGITLPAPDAGGSLVGIDGGRLLDSDGTVIAVPAGALSQTVPIQTKTIAPAVVSGLVGQDFTLLRAVNVNITGAVLSNPAELSIPVSAGFNANLPVVIAKAIDVRGATKLKLVALARLSGSLITSGLSGLNCSNCLNGVTASGTYFFLQAKAPLGFVTGLVTDASSNPFASTLVTTDTCSLADMTNASGTYLVASTVSNFTASAMDIYKYDTGTGIGTISGAGQTATVNLQVKMVPPRVVSISPAGGEQNVLPSTAVVITFSKPLDKTTITSANIVLTDPSGTALAGAYSVNPDSTVVTFYPSALLQSLTQYTLSISKSIKDLQGYLLGQNVTSAFTIKNTTPPPMPPAGSITASFPDTNGYITVTSTQGSVVPNVSVLIINDTTGEIVTVPAQTNGSFTGRISAQLGDEIKIVLMDSSGNQTLVTYITFKSDDGKYLVTTKGGTVTDDASGAKLDIPDGALLGPTIVKITPVTEAQLPQAVPKGGNFLAAVKIDTGGVNFKKEVTLSVPAPSNIPANAQPFVAMPSKLVNPDGTEENVYDIQDSAKVANGRLTTASPPFMFVGVAGTYVFLFPDFNPVILYGRMFRDVNGNGMYDEGADIPIGGGVVRSPEAWSYITHTNSSGFYATYSWAISNIGTCRDFRVTAIDPILQGVQNTAATLCEPPYVSRKDFIFPSQGSPSTDKEPPKIVVNISSDQGFVSGVTPLGATISIEARVSDNVAVNQSRTTLEIKAPGGQSSPALSLDGTTTETVNGIIRQVYIYKATYQPQAAGPYSVKVYAEDMATDPNGVPTPNAATRILTFSSVNQTDIPAGVPGPPSVLDGGVFPAPGSTNLTATTSVQVYFTEAVNNVNSLTFTLYAVSSLNGDPSFVPGPVAGAVVASIEGGRMKALFTPAGNLRFSTHYEVRLSSDITDVDEGNHLVGNTASGYVSTFETKVPDVYDLGDTQFQGRDIDIIGDYAYVAGGASGWHIENISDPTHPSTVYTENHTNAGVMWSYRGVAAQQGVQINTADGGSFSGTLVALTDDVEFMSGDQFTNIRFYDVTNPAAPGYIGHERLGTEFSGIAGSVVLSGQYAYVATVMVGIQVVDIAKAMGPHDYGESIVGYYDSISAGYFSPTDLAMLKGKLYATTTSGHFLVLDTSQPALPTKIGSIDPSSTFRAWRVGVAGDFTYVDDMGTPQTMDIAIVSGGISGQIYIINITNPATPFVIATLNGINATDIKINASAGMAFLGTFNGVMAIDIKNPSAPRVIANVTDTGSNPGIAEKGGWIFTANANTGMKVVNLDPVYLELYCADPEFGEKVHIPCTDYYPALGDKSNGGKKTITLLGRDYTWNGKLKSPARVKFNY